MPTGDDDKDLPGTLRCSPEKAQRTYEKTLESAEEQYDSESRAQRTAWSAVKEGFEKVGDHWEKKDDRGPSDEQARQSGTQARDHPKDTHGGVDADGNTKAELYERAQQLDVRGRSDMTKAELADEIDRKQD